MDLATFQWLAGFAISGLVGLVVWIAKDFNEKIRDLKVENDKLRDALDNKTETLHNRINQQVTTTNAQSVTLAGYQATFMTREEHLRFCQQQHQARP